MDKPNPAEPVDRLEDTLGRRAGDEPLTHEELMAAGRRIMEKRREVLVALAKS